MSDRPSRCPACQSSRLLYGKIQNFHAFVPEARSFMWFPLSAKRGFVCLGCGYMGHYLSENALAKLRSDEAPEARAKRPMDEV